MDLIDTLRTTGAVREFTDEPVPDDVVARVLDTARFAPSGGNRQGWRVVVARDPARRRRLRDLYLDGWYDYLAMSGAGLTPWGSLNDREEEATALRQVPSLARRAAAAPGGFAEHLDEVPVLLVLFADLAVLSTVDRDLPRHGLVGGASIYPFAWSLLLAARAEDLGGVVTTIAVRHEDEVKALFEAPDDWALAAVVALGRPRQRPRRLRRVPVPAWASIDRVGGDPVEP